MDLDEKEKLEELRKIEEKRARIARKNCKNKLILNKLIYRFKRSRGIKKKIIYIIW
jgi:hypothetical protein